MILHSIKSNTNDVIESQCIPESVLKAEKFLRKYHPNFYRMIAGPGYRNCQHADDLERIEIMADITGERWHMIKSVVLIYLNTTEDNIRVLPEDKPIRTQTVRTRFNNGRSGRKRAV